MNLTPDAVNAFQSLLTEPKQHALPFESITDLFVKSDICTAKHILAKQYMEYLQRHVPKVILYIIMDNVFGQCNGKDAEGSLGYYLEFKKPLTEAWT